MLREFRKTLRPLRRVYDAGMLHLKQAPYRERRSPRGSARWLIESEVKYGGYVFDVPRNQVSKHDPRTKAELSFGGMQGGDRMLLNGYAPLYTKALAPFLDRPDTTLAEFGILKGTGLAIWCDLFPDGKVLGFDIDLGHFAANRSDLERRGAFAQNLPAVFEYDQFTDGRQIIANALQGRALDVVIDDGFHSAETIINTWLSAKPFLAEHFAYIIEDFTGLIEASGDEFASFTTEAAGGLTVISRGQ